MNMSAGLSEDENIVLTICQGALKLENSITGFWLLIIIWAFYQQTKETRKGEEKKVNDWPLWNLKGS